MTIYETTIVFDSFLKDEALKALVAKIQNFITNNGGKINQVEEWGKKRMAYEINRKQYGNYTYILFSGPSSLTDLLEREYRLEESILRYLTVKANPKELSEKEQKAMAKDQIETSVDDSLKEPVLDDIDAINKDEGAIDVKSDGIEKSEEAPVNE